MSDDRDKLLDDFGDSDWDSALDAWEKKSFAPAVAGEVDPKQVAPAAPEAPPDELQSANLRAGAAQGSAGRGQRR